jgi:hypothetical protein
VTGRISAGQRGAVQNVYTGNYAYGSRGATYNPSTGVSARGGTITTGNAYTGRQNTASAARVTGPGGQSASAAKVDGNYYATHDGNVYRDTGSGWQHYDNGSWNTAQRPTQVPTTLDADAQARTAGDARAAGSSWGSSSWGDGFDRSSASGGSWWDRSGGGWDRGDGWGRSGGWDTGGGWDRSSGGLGGSSGGSWGGRSGGSGGGGWGGGHFGGFRR